MQNNASNMRNKEEYETRKIDNAGKWVVIGVFTTIEKATKGLSNQVAYEDVVTFDKSGNIYKPHYHVLCYRNDEHFHDMYFDC